MRFTVNKLSLQFSRQNNKSLTCHEMLLNILITDGVSECGTSYYDEYDPFDYLYSCGTQYSDPVYEAVNKIDRSLNISTTTDTYAALGMYIRMSYNVWYYCMCGFCILLLFSHLFICGDIFTTGDWEKQPLDDFPFQSTSSAPPLPPRNTSRSGPPDYNAPSIPELAEKQRVDRLKIPSKLYENVIEDKTYDAEFVAFYNMVGYACA